MKHLSTVLLGLILSFTTKAQKQIYIPQEHQAGINDCSSQYCMGRSYQTDNFLFLWSASTSPNYGAMDACEPIYDFYYNNLAFASTDPSANINNYKIVIMMDPATGGAFGSGVDGVIGAMWVTPSYLGNYVFAHELGHTFSYQAGVDGPHQYGFQDQAGAGGSRIYAGPFWETTANFMAYQYPGFESGATGGVGLYMRTYNYFFTHARSRYEAWPMVEALASELGTTFLGETWLQSMDPEHQVETIKRVHANNSQSEVNDLFAKSAMRLINWDIREPFGTQIRNHVASNYNAYLPVHFQTLLRPIDTVLGRYAVSDNFAPQEYGYNAIRLFPERDSNGEATVYVHFRGIATNDNAGWRYGFVTENNSGTVSYSPVYSDDKQIISTEIEIDDVELYLVIIGAPDYHTNYGWEAGFPKVFRYPYEMAIKNAVPEGYEEGFRMPSGVSGGNHTNGGGFVANSANVSSSVYVGPKAKVLGNATVSGNARVEDWAVVTDNASVSGSAVIGGHALVGGSANVYGSAVVMDEASVSGSPNIYDNAQILDGATIVSGMVNGNAIVKGNAFEWGQTIGGSAVMGGDNENTSASSGVYLQKPDTNNGRTAGDGLGASHESNIDINTIPIAYATDEEMEIPLGDLPPMAQFVASATSAGVGTSVSFTDQSTNSPDAWLWNFGDGQTSALQHPSHAYSSTGTYTVSLTASNSTGSDTETKSNYIVVSDQVNLALSAASSTSYVSAWETLGAINDDSSPTNSNDKSSGAYGNWDNPNSIQWVQYDWAESYDITSVEVYWFDDNGGVLIPTTAYLEYWNGSSWVNVGNVPKSEDTWNTLAVSGVTADQLRLSMLNTSQSTGILEWRVFGTPASVSPTNIAPQATATTSYVSSWETLSAINDDSSPTNSNDKSNGAYGNWDNPNSVQWVQYDWSQSFSITSIEVYWFDDNGGVLTPTTAYLEYWNGSSWVNVGNVPKTKDTWNTLTVSGVTTDQLRLSMLNTSQSTGILEWRVAGTPVTGVRTIRQVSETISLEDRSLSTYPNPIWLGDVLTLEWGAVREAMTKVYVFNSIGQLVLEQKIQGGRLQLETSELPRAGIYYLSVISAENRQTTKIVVK